VVYGRRRGLRAAVGWRSVLLAGFGLVLVAGLSAAWLSARPAASVDAANVDATRAIARGAGTGDVPGAGPLRRMVLVFVSGAVANPGMYHLEAGLRIADAIAAAGGFLADADRDRLPNLAGRLADGKEVKVPRRARASGRTVARVDINNATRQELESVPGMDSQTADAIVSFRDTYGPFINLTQLHTDLGLDPAVVGALRNYLTISY
jgi:competence protein ComEA